jgi:DNA-directed RNA polymerase I, II, and III subunit RPABC1
VKDGTTLQRDPLMLMKRKKDDPSQQIMVFFPEDRKVGVKPIRAYYEMM